MTIPSFCSSVGAFNILSFAVIDSGEKLYRNSFNLILLYKIDFTKVVFHKVTSLWHKSYCAASIGF